jgi:hypothetical protein
MTRGTRYFMIGSAVIVILGIGTGLVAYYNGDLPLLRSRTGPAELSYVPADATAVAYANVREIMDSEFRQKLRQVLPTGEGKDQFLNETGIDLEHDIDMVVAASGGSAPSENGVVLIRGRFDEGRIEALIRQHGGILEEYKGKRLLTTPKGSDDGPPAVAFVETGLVALGNVAAVKNAIDTHASHHDVTGNTELMKFITQMSRGSNTAWAVGGLDAVTKSASVPQQIKDQIPGVQWFAVSAHVNGGVSGVVHAETRDPKSAEDLRAVVNGGLAAARLMSGKDSKLDAIVNSLQMRGTGNDVELAFSVPPDVLDIINGAAGLKHLHDAKPPAR